MNFCAVLIVALSSATTLVACRTCVLRHLTVACRTCLLRHSLPVVLVGYDARCMSYSFATTLVAHSTRCYDTRGLSYSLARHSLPCRNRCYDNRGRLYSSAATLVACHTRLLQRSLHVVLVCYDTCCLSYSSQQLMAAPQYTSMSICPCYRQQLVW